jgi:hypothetical protein
MGQVELHVLVVGKQKKIRLENNLAVYYKGKPPSTMLP